MTDSALGAFADPASTAAHYAARLAFETDASDVAAALESGERFHFIDVRGQTAWSQGHAVGARHIVEKEEGHLSRKLPVLGAAERELGRPDCASMHPQRGRGAESVRGRVSRARRATSHSTNSHATNHIHTRYRSLLRPTTVHSAVARMQSSYHAVVPSLSIISSHPLRSLLCTPR